MKAGLLVFLLLQLTECQLLVDLYYSASTDLELKSVIFDKLNQNYQNLIEIRARLISSFSDLDYYEINLKIIVDLTFSTSISAYIKEYVGRNHIILISTQDLSYSYSRWEFFSHSAQQDHENALNNLVSFFNWNVFIIISNDLDESFLEKYPNKTVNIFYFPNTSDQNLADLFIGKKIKPTGIQNLVILNPGETANKLLKSLENKIILDNGAGVILGSQSSWNAKFDGLIGYTESGLENATDYYSYEALSIAKLLNLILSFPDNSNSLATREFLEKSTVNHYLPGNFTIINIKNSQKVNVGYISQGSLDFSSTLIFPGNSTQIPNSPYTNISIWMGDGASNPLGFANSSFTVVKDGAKYALKAAVTDHFLDGFEIWQTHINCGAEVYEPTFSLNCYKKLVNDPGVAYLVHPFPIVALGDITSMRMLNITIPLIADHVAVGVLANKTEYPEFMRIAGNDDYRINVLMDLMYIFGWKNVLIVTENSTVSWVMYEYLKARAESANINIVNKPEEMQIVENYNPSHFDEYKELMISLLAYKTRPLILNMAPPSSFYFLADMHNAGIEMGDFILLYPNKLAFAYTTISDPSMLESMAPIAYGGIVINEAEWIGEYGKEVLKGFLKEYPTINADFRCFSYDTAMLILYALKYTLDQGQDVYNSSLFNTYLRQQRFLGCSGTVSINSQSNDRNSAPIGIYNLRYDSQYNILYEQLIGAYDLGSLQLFSFYEDAIWYNNKTNTPSDTVENENGCPFKNSQIEYSANGAGILYGISIGIAIHTIVLAFYIWKKWWNVEIQDIREPKLIQFEDYVAMLMILIDFLQLISVGPDIENYDIFTYTLPHYTSINWSSQGKNMWLHMYFALVGILAWLLFCVTIIFRIGENTENDLLGNWNILSKFSIPILGNALFLPFISVFFSVIQCDQQIGSKLSQSFVRKDCSTFCWKDTHILWAILSILSLVLYLPLAIYFRPYWELSQEFINIKTRPLFLTIKSIFQVCIIALSKTVKPQSQALHGLFYCILLFIFTFICLKKKPYNESRMNLWQIISYLAILWSVGLSSLYWIISAVSIEAWMLTEYLGWIILFIIGVYLQKLFCPSMLFNEPGVNVVKLFRFSLGRTICASEINKDIKEQVSRYSFHLSSSRAFIDANSSSQIAIYRIEAQHHCTEQ
ncbi:unnamed protein product [Blepharisma stoltei]|uniref:Receptor ligand binding region domain-containing protein n=1 Tax=Blepharisma stoltei TaxID=1481888 RepID=A0AAU9IFI9_9CILI|nr:unnamed protein product [Blepharisma stoltei]